MFFAGVSEVLNPDSKVIFYITSKETDVMRGVDCIFLLPIDSNNRLRGVPIDISTHKENQVRSLDYQQITNIIKELRESLRKKISNNTNIQIDNKNSVININLPKEVNELIYLAREKLNLSDYTIADFCEDFCDYQTFNKTTINIEENRRDMFVLLLNKLNDLVINSLKDILPSDYILEKNNNKH